MTNTSIPISHQHSIQELISSNTSPMSQSKTQQTHLRKAKEEAHLCILISGWAAPVGASRFRAVEVDLGTVGFVGFAGWL